MANRHPLALGLNARQRAFARSYLALGGTNGTQAAIDAGYSPDGAHVQASRLLSDVKVQAYISELEEQAAKRAEVSIDLVVAQYRDIALADPTELVDLVTDACRYCYGEGHAYQWRTPAERADAQREWASLPEKVRDRTPEPPGDEGGYGYRASVEPNPDCPACEGRGQPRVILKPTAKASPLARRLLAGVKEGRYGIEVQMLDQMAALDALAKHVGVYAKDNEQKGPFADPLARQILERINSAGSRAQLNRGEAAP